MTSCSKSFLDIFQGKLYILRLKKREREWFHLNNTKRHSTNLSTYKQYNFHPFDFHACHFSIRNLIPTSTPKYPQRLVLQVQFSPELSKGKSIYVICMLGRGQRICKVCLLGVLVIGKPRSSKPVSFGQSLMTSCHKRKMLKRETNCNEIK